LSELGHRYPLVGHVASSVQSPLVGTDDAAAQLDYPAPLTSRCSSRVEIPRPRSKVYHFRSESPSTFLRKPCPVSVGIGVQFPSESPSSLRRNMQADNANDEGYCWPSVETLQQKCQLQSLRGARKVLERLEESGFVRRISRPGRSNVYEIIALRLDTPEPQDRGGGTGGPGREEPQDRIPRNGG